MPVVRVVPDVTAVDRAFDYTIDDDVPVGTIVRVPLHGRRVRGWIVDIDVEPEVGELAPVLAVVSAGPPADVVMLSAWIAHRWCGPRVAVLRSASPPNNVPLPPTVWRVQGALARRSLQTRASGVVRWPPLLDRREVVASMCADDGSTIICVADAGRARTLASYLRTVGRTVALMHSAESDSQRTAAWRTAAQGDCVVVGGRVAALAPVPDLAAAVVVDDADEALQEERSPTWHARDVLRERAGRFTVTSPAPTIEAGPVTDEPAPDVERAGWPRVRVVDRRNEPPGAGLLTEAFAEIARNAGGLVVCVLNRRGRFRVMACTSCNHVLRWDGGERPVICPECGATKLRVVRAGVARLGEELAALFPTARIASVDAATRDIPDDCDLVIGTEAVLHRGAIRRRRPSVVAFLDLDQELLAPRYRAASQAHWLVTRGAQLLAARPRTETLLLLQTRIPDHVVVQAVAEGDPERVAASEREYRRTLGYPPFGALAELTGEDEPLAVASEALAGEPVQAFGPNDGSTLVTASDWDTLADALAHALPKARARGRVRAAVDPPRI